MDKNIQQTEAALRALKASEARFLSFVEQASEGIMMLDEQGVIIEFNSALEQMSGFSRQQVMGQSVWDFQFQLVLEGNRTPANYERIKDRWLEAIRTGRSPILDHPLEVIYRRADGSQRMVAQSLFPIKTEAGFRIGGIARDITGQKLAEQALELLVDTQKQIAYLESPQEIYQLVGQVVHKIIGDGYVIVIRSDRRQQTFQAVARYGFDEIYAHVLAAGRIDPFSLVFDTKDVSPDNPRLFTSSQLAKFTGGVFELTCRKFPQSTCEEFEKQMKITGIYAIGFAWKDDQFGNLTILSKSDITPYKEMIETIVNQASMAVKRIQSDQAVRIERDRAQQYLDSAEMILAVADQQGVLTMINQPGCRMLGCTAGELLGKDWVDAWVPVRQRDEVRGALQRYISGEAEAEYNENQVVTRSGAELTVAWHNTLLKDEQGHITGVMAAGMDITQRKQAEQALEWERYLMNSLMDNVPDTIYFKDAQSRILRANQAHARHVRINDPALLVGKTDFDLFGEEHARAAYEDEQAIVCSGQPIINKEEKEDFKDGQAAWVSTTKLPLRDMLGGIIGTFGISRDITGRKQAEQALEWERHLMHALMDNVPYAIYFKDLQGRIFLANQNMLTIQPGIKSLEEIYGKTDFDFFEPEAARLMYEHDQTVIRTGQPLLDVEEEEKWLDRPTTWASTSVIPLHDPEGTIIGTIGISYDITGRKQAEQTLRNSEQRYRLIADNIHDVIWTLDSEFHFTYISPSVRFLRGLEPEEAMQETIEDTLAPDSLPVLQKAIADGLALEASGSRNASIRVEVQQKKKDGSLVWVEIMVQVMYNETGEKTGYSGVSRNITERKQAEEALRHSEEHYRSLFENASFGIFHSSPEGRFLRANPAMAHMLGYSSPEDLIACVSNMNTQLYAHPDRRTQIVDSITQQDDWLHVENEYLCKDGSLITGSLVARRVTHPDGSVAYLECFLEDITQRKRIEDELRLDEKRLEGLLEISQHEAEGIDELLAFAVRQAIDLTESRVAYLFSYDEQKQELTLNLRSMETKDGCGISYPKTVYRLDETGLSGEPVRQRKPVLINDFQTPNSLKRGYPEGHIRIERFLSIPIIAQDHVVGVVAVANKAEDYDQSDIRQITLLMNSVWSMVETKQAEERLRESEERLRFALEAGNDGLWDDDSSKDEHYLSPRYYTILGYQPDEFKPIKDSFESRVHPDDLERVRQALDDYNNGRSEKYEIEFRMFSKSGDVVWIVSRAIATQRDAQGRPVRLVGTHTDITQRKLTEQALAASEKKYRGLMEQASDGIFIIDKGGGFIDVNQAGCEMLGYARQEILNLSLPELTGQKELIPSPKTMLEINAGKSVLSERIFFRKDGSSIPVEINSKMLEDGSFLGIVRDVTERKQAEEALRVSEERFRQVAENTGDFIWEEDASGLYLFANPAVEKILGYSPDELVGKKHWFDQLTPGSRQAVMETSKSTLAREGSFRNVISENLHKDGRIVILESSVSPVLDAQGNLTGYRGADTDITGRIQAEEAVRASEARLKEAERMAHLGSSTWDVVTDTTFWSDEMYRITGRDIGTAPPRRSERGSLYTPESWARLEPALNQALTAGEPYDLELELVRPDGCLRQVHVHGEAETGANGQVVRLHGSVQDITELRLAQENLRQTDQLLNALVEASPLGISALDRESNITLWSPACERLFGWTEAEVLGHPLPTIPDEMQEEVGQQFREEFEGLQRTGFVNSRQRKDGTLLDISLSTAPLRDAQGKIAGSMAIYEDISQRKKAEEAFRESETKFRAIFENSRDAVDVTHNGVHTYVNPAFMQLFGYSDDHEIVGQSLFDLVAEEDRQRVVEMSHDRTLGRDAPAYYEVRGQRKDGSQFDMEVKAVVYELQGKRYTLAVIRDVTERRQAEETLRRSEERYRMLAENMTDTVWVFNMDLKYTYISPSMVRQRGYTLEEINATPLTSQVTPESYARAIQIYQETLRPESLANPALPPRTVELELIRKDGSSFWSENTYILVRDKDGKPAGILGSGRDVTERKHAEQALRESEQRFRSFIEQSNEGVLILDEEGRIIEWNASSEQITGLARQEAIGNYYWEVQDHFVRPGKHNQQIIDRSKALVLKALRTGRSQIFNRTLDAEIIKADGTRRYLRQTVFPIKTEKGFRLGGVSQDITEMKLAGDLRLAKETAEAANRSKSEFLANMSHELRTPLNAVIGFSDMLGQQYYGPLTGKQVEYVKDIHESATYLLALINDILDLSKIEAGRMDLDVSRIDIQSIFEHSLVMVRQRAAKHALYLSSYIDPRLEPLDLMADERKVRQVLYNLLANAVKFTQDGGAIDVSARLVDGVEGQGQSWAEISVSDTGIGLADKDLERVFEAFYQVKSPEAGKTPGTGLGLSLVKRMVELHGGKVWAESKGQGWGSRFVFTLPLTASGQTGEKL